MALPEPVGRAASRRRPRQRSAPQNLARWRQDLEESWEWPTSIRARPSAYPFLGTYLHWDTTSDLHSQMSSRAVYAAAGEFEPVGTAVVWPGYGSPCRHI